MAERVTLRELRDAVLSVWGDVEDCHDCYARDIATITDKTIDGPPCELHGNDRLYRALLATDELLGPCVCGHARSQHDVEDSTACRMCPETCHGFTLPRPGMEDVNG